MNPTKLIYSLMLVWNKFVEKTIDLLDYLLPVVFKCLVLKLGLKGP